MKSKKCPQFLEDVYQPKSILKFPKIFKNQEISPSSTKKSQLKCQNNAPEKETITMSTEESMQPRRLRPLNTLQLTEIHEKILKVNADENGDSQRHAIEAEMERFMKKKKKVESVKQKPLAKVIPKMPKNKLSDQQEFFLKLKHEVFDKIDDSFRNKTTFQIKDHNQSLSLQFQDLNETQETAANTACNQTSLLHLDQTIDEGLNESPELVQKKPSKWFQKRKQKTEQLDKQQNGTLCQTYRSNTSIQAQEENFSFYFKNVSLCNDLEVSQQNRDKFQTIINIINQCFIFEQDQSKSFQVLLNIESLLNISAEIKLPFLHLSLLELNGVAFYALGDYKKAINIFKFYRNLCIFKNFKKEKMRGYKLLFIVYSLMKNHVSACIYLKKWLKHAWENEDVEEELLVYDHLGVYFYYQGDIVTAKYFHERSTEGRYEPKDSVLRKIGVNQLQLKRQHKIQQYHSRLAEKKSLQINVEYSTSGTQLAESIFTDSEDEYNLEVFQMLSKIDGTIAEKQQNKNENSQSQKKDKKYVLNHDRKPNFKLPEETANYGLCYLNPRYFQSRIPAQNFYSPPNNHTSLLSNFSKQYYKKNERLINRFRTKDIQDSFDNNKFSQIKHNVRENTYFFRISHLSCNRDLLNYSKILAENFPGKEFGDQMNNARFQPIEKIKIFEILRSIYSQIEKYLEFITTRLNEVQDSQQYQSFI